MSQEKRKRQLETARIYRQKNREKMNAYGRRYRALHPQAMRDYQKTYRHRHREVLLARVDKEKKRVRNATRKIPTGSECEFCGSTKSLVRHHLDYNYFHIIVTCCKRCHYWLHEEEKHDVS